MWSPELNTLLQISLGIKSILFKKDFIYVFLEKREGRDKKRERNINVWLPLLHPQPGTWPRSQACALDGELNQRPFHLQAGTQSTQPHQPGLKSIPSNNIFPIIRIPVFCLLVCRVPYILAFLGHPGRRVVLGYTLNTLQQVVTHTQNL